MKRNKSKEDQSEIVSGSIGGDSFHEGLFSDPRQARNILKAVRNFFKDSIGESTECESGMLGFAIEETKIDFSKKVKRLRMKTKYATGLLQLTAPTTDNESEESLRNRETKILSEFSSKIYEGHIRSSLQFFRALDSKGRQILVDEFADVKKKENI